MHQLNQSKEIEKNKQSEAKSTGMALPKENFLKEDELTNSNVSANAKPSNQTIDDWLDDLIIE